MIKTKTLIWVTGDKGQIGSYLKDILKAHPAYEVTFVDETMFSGFRLAMFDRRKSKIGSFYLDDPSYQPEIDVSDENNVAAIFAQAKREINAGKYHSFEVWHCAAFAGADKCDVDRGLTYDMNVKPMGLFIKHAAYEGFYPHEFTFVNFSSTSILKMADHDAAQKAGMVEALDGFTGTFDETAIRKPQAWYGDTKYIAEEMFKSGMPKFARCFNVLPVFGAGPAPKDNASDLTKFANAYYQFLQGKPYSFTCKQNMMYRKAYIDAELLAKSIVKWVRNTLNGKGLSEGVFSGVHHAPLHEYFKTIAIELHSHTGTAFNGDKLDEFWSGCTLIPQGDYLASHMPRANWLWAPGKPIDLDDNSNVIAFQPMLHWIMINQLLPEYLCKKIADSVRV